MSFRNNFYFVKLQKKIQIFNKGTENNPKASCNYKKKIFPHHSSSIFTAVRWWPFETTYSCTCPSSALVRDYVPHWRKPRDRWFQCGFYTACPSQSRNTDYRATPSCSGVSYRVDSRDRRALFSGSLSQRRNISTLKCRKLIIRKHKILH